MFVGIDFGTTKSVVAVLKGCVPTVLPDENGRRYMPSIVAVAPDQSLRVGWDALNLPALDRWSSRFFTISSIKRSLGHLGKAKWGEFDAYPQEIAALILSRLKLYAEARLNSEITGVVLAMPAYFNINEKYALLEAAEVAGLRVLRVIHEPTAAALAYGWLRERNESVAVFDFGGGSFDISILEIGEGVVEVKSTHGDTHIGGLDLTQAIVEYARGEFKRQEGLDIASHPEAMARLHEAAEQAKCELSSRSEVSLSLPYVVIGPPAIHLDIGLSREHLEELTAPVQKRIADCCRQALADSGLSTSEIDNVIMIGAATRTPSIASIAREVFQREPLRSLDPTEAVAMGAAVQAGVLAHEIVDILLLDVIPLTIGVEDADGVMMRMIPRNTTIPTRKSEKLVTSEDNQREIRIRLCQGEREIAADNIFIGEIVIRDLPPAPKGLLAVEVTFDLEGNGILRVQAKNLTSGQIVDTVTERPSCCLNEAQKKVLSRKVEAELRLERERIKAWLDERGREDADGFAKKIVRFVGQAALAMDAPTAMRLKEGERLIQDFVERRASADDLKALIARIKIVFDQAAVDRLLQALDRLWSSEAFRIWAEESGRPDYVAESSTSFDRFENAGLGKIAAVREAFEFAVSDDGANIGRRFLIDAVAPSRNRRLCLELVASCFPLPNINIPDWAVEESDADGPLRAVLTALARRARRPGKRSRPWDRICRLSDGSDVVTLLEAVAAEREYMVGQTLAEAVFDKFGDSIWKTFSDTDWPARERLLASPIARRLAARSAARALSGVNAPDAIKVLDETGVEGSEDLIRENLPRFLLLRLEDPKLEERVKVMAIDAASKTEGKPPVEPVLAFSADRSPAVREKARLCLRQWESAMDAAESRLFNLAKKLGEENRAPRMFEKRFLKKISKERPGLRLAADRLRESVIEPPMTE